MGTGWAKIVKNLTELRIEYGKYFHLLESGSAGFGIDGDFFRYSFSYWYKL